MAIKLPLSYTTEQSHRCTSRLNLGKEYVNLNEILVNSVNRHDHDIYLMNIEILKKGAGFFELANNKGIASIYIWLSNLFPYLLDPELERLSLIFNCIVLMLCYYFYGRISDKLNLGLTGRASFFVNTSMLYFAQLINKDMLTILIFLLCIHFGIKKRPWFLLALLPGALFVRLQLVIYIIIYVYLSMNQKGLLLRFVIVYICTSLLAAYLTVYYPIIGSESLGDGFSAFLIEQNRKHFLGYLLFNPIRITQYIYDIYRSFWFFNELGRIDVAKLLRIPQLILLLLLLPQYKRVIIYWKRYSNTYAKPIVIGLLSYISTWLMNPTVNARYVILVTPILTLLGLYIRSARRYV